MKFLALKVRYLFSCSHATLFFVVSILLPFDQLCEPFSDSLLVRFAVVPSSCVGRHVLNEKLSNLVRVDYAYGPQTASFAPERLARPLSSRRAWP